jgi:sterol desaturase/sphingolipid hydroxylase (fatty acid hydroxylase superfamily)
MVDLWIVEHANSVQGILFFILFAVLAFVEMAVPTRPRLPRPNKRWVTNLALTTVNIFVLSLLPITFFGAAVWAQTHGYGLLNGSSLPFGLVVVATLLARGFISFFTHYLMHKVNVLWRLHRVHHLDTELDITSTVRVHPLEFIVALVPGVAMVVAVGMSPWVLLLYEILDATVTVFSHANISLPRGVDRVLRYIIVTPDLHRVHHSSWQPETDSNFSAVFPIWDVICGTFRTETRRPHATMELGLEAPRDERTDRFFWLLGSPFFRVESTAGQASSGTPRNWPVPSDGPEQLPKPGSLPLHDSPS